MCGIAGLWGKVSDDLNGVASAMALAIEHRGPDGQGIYVDQAGLALCHRRLAVIDVSCSGAQPMHSKCGRYVLVYNGELYNYRAMRADLERRYGQIAWVGESDTEVLLESIVRSGLQETLQVSNGMFAFALWDKQQRTLYIARDRMGEKPLYYGSVKGVFVFGSELKALRAHPNWTGEIDRDVLPLFFRHNYIPAPHSIYKGIYKLPPAHFLEINEGNAASFHPVCYWDLGRISEQNSLGIDSGKSVSDYVQELDDLLRDSVRLRMKSDVPLGAFLSGGIDSSIVVSMMQSLSEKPVSTFTIGFAEDEYNESDGARGIAQFLGTQHNELYVTAKDALDVVPKLPLIWDEPFSDSSQIPTLLVSQLARKHVTVTLSGDGGDELFCGYERYQRVQSLWGLLEKIPWSFRAVIARLLESGSHGAIQAFLSMVVGDKEAFLVRDRIKKANQLLTQRDEVNFYRAFVSHWTEIDQLVLGAGSVDSYFTQREKHPRLSNLLDRMMFTDSQTYLPGDILTKVDRATMALSLEGRIPLLDHRLVEFSWSVPAHLKMRNKQGKWILREVLNRYIPEGLTDRPKKGFGIPLDDWLKGELRDWAESLLDETTIRNQGYLDAEVVSQKWAEHKSGTRRWHYYLWDVLMFQSWLSEYHSS